MSKFNLSNISRKNLIIGISIFSALVLIITFFLVNFRNPKLGDVNSSNSLSNSIFSNSSNQNSSISSNFSQKVENSQIISQSNLSSISNTNSANISTSFNSILNSNSSLNSNLNLSQNTQNSTSPSTNLPNNNPNLLNNSQIYTNPNYPNLKINYDNSWKIERINNKAVKTDNPDGQLMDGVLTLTKNNTVLKFSFLMPQKFGGGFNATDKILANLGKLKRYNQSIPAITEEAGLQKDKYYYTENGEKTAMNNIKTNLTKNDISQKEMEYFPPDSFTEGKLNYLLLITLNSTNPSEIKEADEIIKNSVLE